MRSVLLLFLVASVVAAQAVPSRKDIPAIAKAANGAIVSIIMSDKDGQPIAQGTGFLISKDGRIVTNYHVIETGNSAIVKLPDGIFFAVDGVLAFDKSRDVAVIKAHGENFRTLTLGNSDRLQVGEEVVAIGNPLSLESTVSNGIVSGIRTVEEEGGKFLQVTAPISPGSSGGPLFNMKGEVVGITTLYLKGGENLNFAIPINDAKRLLLATLSKVQALPDEPEPKETHYAQATPSQQKTCSEQAEKFVRYKRAEYGDDAPAVEYTSHYDARVGKCYVESTFYFVEGKTYPSGHRYGSSRDINDASFEGSGGPIYGFFGFPSTDGARWSGPSCTIHPPGRPEIICRTEEEFNDLALKYFGTTPK